MCVFRGSDMDANLSQLVNRLEAVANRLENVSGQSSASTASSQSVMDSGLTRRFDFLLRTNLCIYAANHC